VPWRTANAHCVILAASHRPAACSKILVICLPNAELADHPAHQLSPTTKCGECRREIQEGKQGKIELIKS